MSPPPRCAPVLLLAFNRPELTRRCVEAIRHARPARVYVAADGPRPGRPGERETCERARRTALESIDWPCEVRTLFREENLGCARAVHGAVSWFFEQEDAGIVLEDDCLAAPAFFRFCTELLEQYRSVREVFAISGDNFIEADTPPSPSYWFNRIFHVWGWATWRDRWAAVPPMVDAPDGAAVRSALRRAGLSAPELAYWTPLFERVRPGTEPARRIDSWAYPAAYHVLVNRALCICPARNLVTNVGFGPDSTHFADAEADGRHSIAAAHLEFPLIHPASVRLERTLYRKNLRQHFGIPAPRWPALIDAARVLIGRPGVPGGRFSR